MPAPDKKKRTRSSRGMSKGATALEPLARGSGYWTEEATRWSREQREKDEEALLLEVGRRGAI